MSHLQLFTDVLLHPNFIEYADYRTLCSLIFLNKYHHQFITTCCDSEGIDKIGFWKALCNSFAFYNGLFFPLKISEQKQFFKFNFRKFFYDELFISKNKFLVDDNEHISYHIKVACRLRPGVIGNKKLCLPLHQYLKVKRKQSSNEILVGEVDPEEFVDPLLGNLMKDPVLLTSSNRIVDRSVALQCILRGGKDPFNNKKLNASMLIDQTELREKIFEWKRKKEENSDVSVDVDEAKVLIDENSNNSDLIDALLQVEKINNEVKKMQTKTTTTSRHNNNNNEFDDIFDNYNEPQSNTNFENDINNENINNLNQNEQNFDSVSVNNNSLTTIQEEDFNITSKQVETSRIIDISKSNSTVSMHIPGLGVRPFHYSILFDGKSTQGDVFNYNYFESIVSVLNGFNSCVLCYGQTGSGKTYTFFGPDEAMNQLDDLLPTNSDTGEVIIPNNTGLVVRNCVHFLEAKNELQNRGINITINAQFIEIYEEQVIDLLSGSNVTIRRDNGEVNGALESEINSIESAIDILRIGHSRKRFAATAMNERSSRSHTAFIITVIQKIATTHDNIEKNSNYNNNLQKDKMVRSQLYLVDLAGSERIKKSKVTGHRMREAVGINSSLLVLGKCISSLVEGKSHIPYLECKLTTLLKKAFGGNSRTTAIINCRSDDNHGDETLQSMRFGERCGMISNSMRQTASSFDRTLSALDDAIKLVQSQLETLQSQNREGLSSYKHLQESCHNLIRKRNELMKVNEAKISIKK